MIALACTLSGAQLILDDLAARKHASLLGLRPTGTLGVLLKAKQNNLIDRLEPQIAKLITAGFRLAESTRDNFLKMAGE